MASNRRASVLEQVGSMLAAWWTFPPSDDELAAIASAAEPWSDADVDVLLDAVEEATRTQTDRRPTVAWIVGNARQRLKLRRAQRSTGVTRPGCTLCRGGRMIAVEGAAGLPFTDPSLSPLGCELAPCPNCAHLSHELWKAGAYDIDADRRHPRFAAIVAEYKQPPKK